MGLQIQGKSVSGVVVGGDSFVKPDYNSMWLECPDEGVEGQDFKGQTLMKFDEETNIATFKSNATVKVPANYTPTNPLKRLAITLPNGFEFLDNEDTAVFYDHYAVYGNRSQNAEITTQENKLYCQLRNNDQNPNPFYMVKISSEGLVTLDSEVIFNVGKI